MVMRMLVIVAMAMVHEQVHQRAGQQEQIRQYPQHVCAVLCEQKEPGNREKTIEHPARSGKVLCFVLIRHDSLLFQNLFLMMQIIAS
jgi:hypothetical protein